MSIARGEKACRRMSFALEGQVDASLSLQRRYTDGKHTSSCRGQQGDIGPKAPADLEEELRQGAENWGVIGNLY